MNGIYPIFVATGNDWRAVEAGTHARNIALQASAAGEEIKAIIRDMIRAGEITADHASTLLSQHRKA